MSLLDFLNPVGQIGSQLIAAQSAKKNTLRTIEANKNMAEYAYSKDLEMWNRQNEYNSPTAQMERFKDAGLNPNLIYGQGSSGNATTLPKYQAPTAEYNFKPAVDPGSILSAYQDMKIKQAQIDNIKAQTKNTQANEELTRIHTWLENMYGSGRELNKNEILLQQATQGNVKTRVAQATEKALISSIESNLAKTQADVQSRQTDVALKNFELQFRKMFGPLWSTILSSGVGLIKGFIPMSSTKNVVIQRK